MTKERLKPIPKRKTKEVKEISELIKKSKTVMIASIKNLPASQLQEAIKKLRGKAVVKVPKKNIIFRALDDSGKKAIQVIREQIKGDITILFSDMDSFELAAELVKNKSPAKAKVNQEAVEDIEIPAGPTDLVPGPAISELGALGIKIAIENGKINIKAIKVIVKKGEKISANAADVMNKLDIKPFLVGLEPIAAFDTQEEKLYLNIRIDKEKTVNEIKISFGRALPFAVGIGYTCKETIIFLIGKAGMHENAIKSITGKIKEEDSNVPKENQLEGNN
ncbi:MAG: 50S ribosomal protein L10 [Nanoarchaeota archaeon]|nr:50S ribosomal protein L10 [Nanoarchaeota archaeon]